MLRIISLAALSIVLLGAMADGCFPIIDERDTTPALPSTPLGAAVSKPSTNRTVPVGTVVTIEWSAANLTGEEGVATVLVVFREDQSETIIDGGVLIQSESIARASVWDTAGFAEGEYAVRVRVEAGGKSDEATAPGAITLDDAPSFTFTEPFQPTSLTRGGNDPIDVTIRWSAGDSGGDGKATLAVDPDLDHESGNEIDITEVDLPTQVELGSFDWNGNDIDGNGVEAGTYNLFARVTDGAGNESIVNGLATITVVVDDSDPVNTELTEPAEDTEMLGDATVTIKATFDEENDVLIDLKVDDDDDHQNGNEITVLSQRLITSETHEDTFVWNGQDASGTVVRDGIYRAILLVHRGGTQPTIIEGDALIFRRAVAEKPLIACINPATNQTLKAGQFLSIAWRDEDPGETAKVTLTLVSGATPPVETVILSNREAKGDDVQDSFSYQIPLALAPGIYSIRASIDRDDATPPDHDSTAVGKLIIKDPNDPNNN